METRFRAMGTEVHVVVTGDGTEGLIARARRRIEALESLWSRFLDTSEISKLNAAGGEFVVVSSETFALVRLARDAYRETKGLFDPTVLRALMAAGYDRSFDRLAPGGSAHSEPPFAVAPGCERVELDPVRRAVALPPGVAFDAGGIGKGYAADLVAGELFDAGARGVCVNIGGDLRGLGVSPVGSRWTVAVEDPATSRVIETLSIADGGIATSSRVRRRWMQDGVERHHLIDPASGLPSVSDVASLTVVAPQAWRAEVLAKAAFLSGVIGALRLLPRAGAAGIVIDTGGGIHRTAGIEEYVA